MKIQIKMNNDSGDNSHDMNGKFAEFPKEIGKISGIKKTFFSKMVPKMIRNT